MKRLAILLSVVVLSACDGVVEPERALVPVRAVPASTLVPAEITEIDLGTLAGSPFSRAVAINELGEVAGNSFGSPGGSHAFVWRNGTMTDLGRGAVTAMNDVGMIAGENGDRHAVVWENGVATVLSDTRSMVSDVNNRGQVVWWRTQVPFARFIWENGTSTELGKPTGHINVGQKINDAGQVVGFRPASSPHAWLWQNGTMTDLGTLPGADSSVAEVVNEVGQVAGYSGVASGGEPRYFFWQNGTMTELPHLPGTEQTKFTGINDLGHLVGLALIPVSADRFTVHAFVWQNGVMTDLSTPDRPNTVMNGNTINNLGQVAGTWSDELNQVKRGFVWQNGVMTDLGLLDSDDWGPIAINDRGQIVGQKQGRATLWNTMRPATPAEEVSILTGKVNTLCADATLSHGQCQSLLSKLNAASSQIARGNAKAAGNVLQAFIKHVEGQVAGGLYSAATGQTLIDAAQSAIVQLSA